MSKKRHATTPAEISDIPDKVIGWIALSTMGFVLGLILSMGVCPA